MGRELAVSSHSSLRGERFELPNSTFEFYTKTSPRSSSSTCSFRSFPALLITRMSRFKFKQYNF